MGTGFGSPLEFTILLVICCGLIIIGIPFAISHKSFIGWIIAGIGATGVLAMLINSIASHREPPDYDNFLLGIFLFFVILGVTAGIFTGSLNHSPVLGLFITAGGLVSGYFIGIFAGLWLQHLGWLASILNGIAALAVVGMFVVDIVILSSAFW